MSRLFPLLLTVCTATASAQPFGLDDLSGGELFARFCASCHGESGHGNGPVARTLNTVVPDVTRLRERYGEFAADDIRQIIDGRSLVVAHGTRYMPVWDMSSGSKKVLTSRPSAKRGSSSIASWSIYARYRSND